MTEKTLDVDRLLEMSQTELDELFRSSPAGDIPSGEAEGTVLVARGETLSEIAAKLVHYVAWQGKVFDPDKGELVNRVSPLGIEAVRSKVYKGASWLDEAGCIVLDYSETSLIAHWIRARSPRACTSDWCTGTTTVSSTSSYGFPCPARSPRAAGRPDDWSLRNLVPAQGSGKCSWPSEGPFSLFEAVHADLTVVTDLPSFHIGCPLPEGFEITGPVVRGRRCGHAGGLRGTARGHRRPNAATVAPRSC